LREAWQEQNRVQHILFKAFGLIPILLLVNAPDHVYAFLKHPDTDLARYGQTVDSLNRGIHMALLLVSAIVALQLAWDIARASVDYYRKRSQAH